MSLSNYTDLQAAVTNWLAKSGLTERIPEFIKLGESYLNRRIRVLEMESSATITPSTTLRYVDLPAGFMELVSFTDDYGEKLIAVPAEMLERIAYAMSPCRPRHYRISSRIDFEVVADATYNYKLKFLKRLDIQTDLTNAILTKHPDCYLYASLMQAEPYIRNDPRVNTWKQLLVEAINEANRQSNKSDDYLTTEFVINKFDINRGY